MSTESWDQGTRGQSRDFHRKAERYTPDPKESLCALHALASAVGVPAIDRRYAVARRSVLLTTPEEKKASLVPIETLVRVGRSEYMQYLFDAMRDDFQAVKALYRRIQGDRHSELGNALRQYRIMTQKITSENADAFVKGSKNPTILYSILKHRNGMSQGHYFFARHVPFLGLMDANFTPWNKVEFTPPYPVFVMELISRNDKSSRTGSVSVWK